MPTDLVGDRPSSSPSAGRRGVHRDYLVERSPRAHAALDVATPELVAVLHCTLGDDFRGIGGLLGGCVGLGTTIAPHLPREHGGEAMEPSEGSHA